MPSVEGFLALSATVFCIGLYGALSRRNVVIVLMSIELMFNAINIAAVAFSRFTLPEVLTAERLAANPGQTVEDVAGAALGGQVFALFIVAVAAAEVALGLALVISLYRSRETVDLTEANLMKR